MPGVSTKRICDSSVLIIPRIRLRVVCGFGEVIAIFWPTIRFNRVDLPTLGRPTIATKPEEHGEWVAKATKSILLGRKPSEIPITYNKIGRMTVNLDLAKKMKIKFPVNIIERAKVVVQ